MMIKYYLKRERSRLLKGFTLVELLVVIAIISILAGMLMPALENAIDSARTVACINNLKQVGITACFYSNDNYGWVQMSWAGGAERTGSPWVLLQEGYLDQTLDLTDIDTLNGIFNCPDRPSSTTNYSSESGLGAMGYNRGKQYVEGAGMATDFGGTLPIGGSDDDPFYVNFASAPAKIDPGFTGDAKSINDLPMYGDSWIDSTLTNAKWYGNVIQGYHDGFKSSFHLRHSGFANCWFLDGHATGIDEAYAVVALDFNLLISDDMTDINY